MNICRLTVLLSALGYGVAFTVMAQTALLPARQVISLSGNWLFQREGAKTNEWKTVTVPSSFEQHEGTGFNGVGWYRKTIAPLTVSSGKRVLLHFQAAATDATVWWNDTKLGTHLGGWTPFRFDITDLLRNAPAGHTNEVRVRLDEKVGHNTQGFLPIIAPHFGGLWQDVRLLIVPETYCDDLQLLAIGDPATSEVHLEIPLAGTIPPTNPPVHIKGRWNLLSKPTDVRLEDGGVRHVSQARLKTSTPWLELPLQVTRSGQALIIKAPVANHRLWSPESPFLYDLEISIADTSGDRVTTRTAFRKLETFGAQFRLNGRPLQIRGLLNWGYSPPLTAPNPGETAWRQELEFAAARGFNLMKFCLWIPPQRYLELADELGMLTWMEYPTWHPDLTQKYLAPLQREFKEFFYYDRNHPSIILRSLTCETGASADLQVIQRLYDLAKATIPGALVEDDSSWIGWNRVHDFYDDHPYGNNSTWVNTLQGFEKYILAHGLKPLVLGEAIAADTWINREAILTRLGKERPWWAPGPLDEIPPWETHLRSVAGPDGFQQLRLESLHYGMLMRKYQIEAYRREVPYGGYVISVIRDIPNASMGLIDYLNQPKWSAAEWSWQRDTLCLLKTKSDHRSFACDEHLQGEILLSHYGSLSITNGELIVTLEQIDQPKTILQRQESKHLDQNIGTLASVVNLDWPLPAISQPAHLLIRAVLKTSLGEFNNQWPIWIIPVARPTQGNPVQVHSSLSTKIAKSLFPGAVPFQMNARNNIVIAAQFDDPLVQFLEAGGCVLFLPNGQKNSFPLNDHWFLRGAPYIPDVSHILKVPRDLLVELQHFDLSSSVVPDIKYLEAIHPLLLLWDTHDLKTVKTHGLIFETRVGKGHLLVSAINHVGQENAAGRWLLQALLDHLRSGKTPQQSLPNNLRTYLK